MLHSQPCSHSQVYNSTSHPHMAQYFLHPEVKRWGRGARERGQEGGGEGGGGRLGRRAGQWES